MPFLEKWKSVIESPYGLLLCGIFNIPFGIICVVIGSWLIHNGGSYDVNNNYNILLESNAFIIAAGCSIAFGVIMMLAGVLLITAKCKGGKLLFWIVVIICIILLVLDIAAICLVAKYKASIRPIIVKELASSIKSRYQSKFRQSTTENRTYDYEKSDLISQSMDMLQIKFSCCGIDGYQDYAPGNLSVTCCKIDQSDKNNLLMEISIKRKARIRIASDTCPSNSSEVHKKGCLTELDILMDNPTISYYVFSGYGLAKTVIDLIPLLEKLRE